MSGNFYDDLSRAYVTDPARDFLRQSDGRRHSFGSLDARSAMLAAVLAQVGATAGDRIVVQVEKSPDAVALYLACLRRGLVFVPLNPAYTADEVAFMLRDAEPRVFIGTPSRHDSLELAARSCRVPEFLTLGERGDGTLSDACSTARAPVVDVSPDALAAILYTSGTTGRAKGAMLSHENLRSNATALHALWGFRVGDVLLHALPIFHAHGLFVALHCAMLNGSELLFLPRFDVAQVRAWLPHASVMMGVPTYYSRLLAEPEFGPQDCCNVRLFISGSAPLPEPVFQRFEERVGQPILERYGMTEAGMITSNPLSGERVAGTVGFPLPGVDVRVTSESGGVCQVNEVGSVEIRGPNVFRGYWHQAEATRAAFTPDRFFSTGDLGLLDAEGRLSLIGRESDLVISGGLNVYPKEIEACLDEIQGVTESAVIGVPHPDLGEAVVALIVGDEVPGEVEIRAALQARLAGFKHPKRVVVVESLARNAMGKVQKNRLRSQYANLFER